MIRDSVAVSGGGVPSRLDGSGSEDGSDDRADGLGEGEQATKRVALRSAAQETRWSALGRYSPMPRDAVPALVLVLNWSGSKCNLRAQICKELRVASNRTHDASVALSSGTERLLVLPNELRRRRCLRSPITGLPCRIAAFRES